jgi:hypothetical protein
VGVDVLLAGCEPIYTIGTPLSEFDVIGVAGIDRVLPRLDYPRKIIRVDHVIGGPILQFV